VVAGRTKVIVAGFEVVQGLLASSVTEATWVGVRALDAVRIDCDRPLLVSIRYTCDGQRRVNRWK
jgi:hypothetical protein